MNRSIFILCLTVLSLADCVVAAPSVVSVANVSELQEALDKALPDDLIQLAPGKYSLKAPLRVHRSGLSSKPITIIASSKRDTIITGPFGIDASNAVHIVFEDIIWFNIQNHPVVTQRGSAGIKFYKNEFHRCGLIVEQEHYERQPVSAPVHFQYCFFRLCQPESLLHLKRPGNRVMVNTFDRCRGVVWLEGDGSVIRGNYFLQENEVGTKLVALGNAIKVMNNYFLRDTSGSSKILVQSSRFSVVAHNTFMHCERPYVELRKKLGTEESVQCTVENNLIVNEATFAGVGPVFKVDSDGDRITWGANLVFPATAKEGLAVGAQVPEKKWVLGDPGLQAVGGIWQLTPGSLAEDAGTNHSGATMTDIEGKIRGLRPDIGAHEASNEAITHPRPVSAIVEARRLD